MVCVVLCVLIDMLIDVCFLLCICCYAVHMISCVKIEV
jgi:hypothetical protein